VFDAFIQTPHRFSSKSKLWRYCRLGIKKQSSGGKQAGPPKLRDALQHELDINEEPVKEPLSE
jgi:transposase